MRQYLALEQAVIGCEQGVKVAHPRLHVVLEKLGQILNAQHKY